MTKTTNLASSCSKTPSYSQADASEHHRYQTCKQDSREHGDGGCLTVLLATVATSHLPVMPNAFPFPMVLPGGNIPSSPTSSPVASREPGLFPALPLLLPICLPARTNKGVIICTQSRHVRERDPRTPNPRRQTPTRQLP